MALSDTKLRNLKPGEKPYIETDEGGLHLEVMPGGAKVWRLRYRVGGRDAKQEKITLGDYPIYGLADARTWRDDCKALAGRGLSPMALKRGDPIPDDASPTAKELAQFFIRNWCLKAVEKAKAKEAETKIVTGGESTADKKGPRWFSALLTLKKAEAKPEAEEAIESRLAGSIKNFSGRRSFTLENGQVWQMIEADSYAGPTYERPVVRVRPGLFGTFWLQIPEAAVRVKVKPVKLE